MMAGGLDALANHLRIAIRGLQAFEENILMMAGVANNLWMASGLDSLSNYLMT